MNTLKQLNKRSRMIIISVLFSSLLMCFVDGVIQPDYAVKSLIKILFFLGVPMLYFGCYKDELSQMKQLWKPRKKDFIVSLLLGAGVYLVILIAYLIFKNWIDFREIKETLTAGIGVNADNFLFVALYISFINSMLEEFFFRGFAFLTLKQEVSQIFAYLFSSFMFALYHVGMTSGWFGLLTYILTMLGLFIGGCIFNYLNEKCGNIYPSWLVHMFANFAINTIGCLLFGIL